MADMASWAPVKLKDVCTQITVGFVGSMADEYCDDGVPFLRSLNIHPFRINTNDLKYIPQAFHEKIRKSTLRPGDVGIVRTGYPGTACVIPPWLKEANCSDLVIVRPGPALNPHFLAAVFNSSFGRDLVGGNLVGAAQQHFNVTVAKELKLLLPPRDEQDKIAAILSAYDDLIANNQRRIALLEGTAEEIYREWFVRMRFPGWRQATFRQGIPANWATEPIEALFKTVSGGTPSRTNGENFGGEIHWVKTGELKSMFVQSTDETLSAKGLESSAAKVLPKHTVVMAMYCAMPDVAILGVDAATNQACCALLPKRAEIRHEWAYFFAVSALQQMVNFAHGAAQQNLSQEIIRRFRVLYPGDELVAKYADHAKPLFEQIALLSKSTKTIAEVRDALLPRLISGKLKVDHLDIRLPPSMRAEVEAAEATA